MSNRVRLTKVISPPRDSDSGSPTSRPSISVKERSYKVQQTSENVPKEQAIPIHTPPADQENPPPPLHIERGHKKRIKVIVSMSTPSTYWRNTFALTTSPLILSGFPSYILLKTSSSEINSVRQWVLHLLDFRSRSGRSLPLTLLTCALLLLTLCLHLVLLQHLAELHESLFVSGEPGSVVTNNVGHVIVYLTQVVALNYFWLYGFKIKRLIDVLDKKHGRRNGYQVRCGYRTPLLILMVILVAHVAAKYTRPAFVSKDAEEDHENVILHVFNVLISFSNYVFFACAFPVYCTFCFGIRFELLLIKAYLYDQIAKRVTPNVKHLNKIKIWFTQAADHIVYVNSLYWAMLAVVIAIWFWEIMGDAKTLTKLLQTQIAVLFEYVRYTSAGNGDDESFKTNNTLTLAEEKDKLLNPEYAVKVYKDIVWVTITCSIMVYTVWQAVLTNDAVKHVQNWLNDFGIGGGGSDVDGILNELTVVIPARSSRKKTMTGKKTSDDGDLKEVAVVRNGNVVRTTFDKQVGDDNDDVGELEYESESEVPLLWCGHKVEGDGEDYDDMLFKANNLRTYISVRMKLENPALLSVMVFGNMIPYFSNRLQGYNL